MTFSNVPEYTWGVDMDKEKFKEMFPKLDSVTVIRGFCKNTDAYKKWNVNTIGKIFGKQKLKMDSYSQKVGHWHEKGRKKTMQEYIDYMKKYKNPDLYLAEFNLKDYNENMTYKNSIFLKEIVNDLYNENYVEHKNTFDKNIMYFGKNACTECHIHFVDNYIVNQIFGSKTFYCFDYNDNDHIMNKNTITDFMTGNNIKGAPGYPYSYNNADGTTTKTFMDLDFNNFSKLYKINLNPGDTLLIPPWWWHTTQGHDINCTVINTYKRKNLTYLLKSLYLLVIWYTMFGTAYFFDNIASFLIIFSFILMFFNILDKYAPNKYNKYIPFFLLFLYPILGELISFFQQPDLYFNYYYDMYEIFLK